MERLTERNPSWIDDELWERACEPDCEEIDAVYRKLKDYEDAEEQGLLLRLPCGIGSDVYTIPSKVNYELNILNLHTENNKVYHQKVALITFTEKGWYMECDKDREYATYRILPDKMYKETWFLSQEEAEAKLKEIKNGGNRFFLDTMNISEHNSRKRICTGFTINSETQSITN